MIRWAHLPLRSEYSLQLIEQKSLGMVTYPVLTITICTIIMIGFLRRSAEPSRARRRPKHEVQETVIEEKKPRELHSIPSVVQPNRPVVVARRDASRLYLATLPCSINDKHSSDEEKQSVEDTSAYVIDCATTDFLCIATDKEAQRHVLQAIDRYGVGSCGPRGFFGTLTPHVMVEREFTAFLNQPAILYPSAAVVIPSALPILCSKGDILLIPEVHSLEIARAAALCGAKVLTVHLPYLNLREILEDNGVEECASNLKSAMCKYLTSDTTREKLREFKEKLEPILTKASTEAKNTCWLVADTITKDGILCLPEILSVCEASHVRIFLNEGLGLGVLGSEGRGVPEFWCDIGYATGHHHFDLVAGSLEHAFAGLGGICTGALHLVEQQRNMGLGYCFSASAPPGLCECVRYTLRQISGILPSLRETVWVLHRTLLSAGIPFVGIPGFPVVFIRLPVSKTSTSIQERLLCCDDKSRFLVCIVDDQTIRISIAAKHEKGEIKKLVECLADVFEK